MRRQRAVSIIAAIMRNVEMDTARAQALRRGIPAPLAEVGEALHMALDALQSQSDGGKGYGQAEGPDRASEATEGA